MADTRKCQCGTVRTEHKGVYVCTSHCDIIPHAPDRTDAACMNYGAAINLRVIREHMEERRGPRRTDD